MNRWQIQQARKLAAALAETAVPYEAACFLVAGWMKRRGIAISRKHLELAFGQFID